MIKTVDCRGLVCPLPVVNARKLLAEIEEGTVVVIVDNQAAKENVMVFGRNAGYRVDVEEKREDYILTITKNRLECDALTEETASDAGLQGRTFCKGEDTVYFIASDLLGDGSLDLGHVLMKSLILTLAEQQPSPVALIFLNTGVRLSTEGSPVLEHLQALADKGVVILSCGTCLDYYNLKEKLAVGRVSNMYEINEYLSKAKKVIAV
ncbi:MAG: sulfurtransferase-like selenium metabolism protein YedF [Peptococcaceae bacterium]|nr:MAG: sulfurtransferase-like selenium metabolism protein YedF [Peptococcaceae bacterium]